MRRVESFVVAVFVLAASAVAASCAQEEYPAQLWNEQHAATQPASPTDAAPASAPTTAQYCSQSRAQSLPARLLAIGAGADAGAEAGPSGTTYYVSDLLAQFQSICGRCHGSVGGGLGGFSIVTQQDFLANMTPAVIAHVTSNGTGEPGMPSDPNSPIDPMPPFDSPAGMPYSQRPPTDPVKQFAELVQAWLADQKPQSFVYTLPGASSAGAGGPQIPVPNALVGNAMTNIGNCVPSPGLIGTQEAAAEVLDAKFAALHPSPAGSNVTGSQMIGLPVYLSDTDLFTLDSAVLARYGVVAYAPGYPLWSDNAGKLRHIRVPRGTSVVFDKEKQTFAIPPNTRFYKTFMKQVVDLDGSMRYRKIETRLIVSRPDKINSDGSTTPTALFGTYKWSDDESQAVLVTTPLNDGEPFADTLIQYDTNEPLANAIRATSPADPDEAVIEGGAARHYAIPSSQRCVQCHEGSVTKSFNLGFLPLQINRFAQYTHGVIEEAGPDELTQLQRLIDYGVITGIDSPSDVLPLEQSQGSRAPRNYYELTAQGYMLGNCAHCHNPGGFPSLQNPVLVNVLNFYPSAAGGVFQFPLEKTSPRIFRGAVGQTQIPYITPSLMDMPRFGLDGNPTADLFTLVENGDNGLGVETAWYAPWRSLIYRNVDDPFAYQDDLALFPHMPMNTPGYDPRAKQIMSAWMVSIPAVRKSPDIPEYAVYYGGGGGSAALTAFGPTVDANEQPYVEVFPGDPRYDQAQMDAQNRLSILFTGINPFVPSSGSDAKTLNRYTDPGVTDDILDPAVEADPACHPIPKPIIPVTPAGGLASEVVPGHCHWVITDLTQPPGPWSPRRPDWELALVEQMGPPQSSTCGPPSGQLAQAKTDANTAVQLLQSVTLAPAQDYLTTLVPFGLWQELSGCDYSSVQTVSSFSGSNQPLWMSLNPELSANAPVYMSTPGEAVFKQICINCHGPLADANGRLAQNLATMTGGLAEVADFRDGLFGPVGAPSGSTNIDRVFGISLQEASWSGTTNDDRAARYMAWMALGGTNVSIPPGILSIVSLTQVLGTPRQNGAIASSANMLSSAKSLCNSLLGAQSFQSFGFVADNPTAYDNTLIHSNGDAELWLHLCALNNPPPVHVIYAPGSLGVQQAFDSNDNFLAGIYTLISPDDYPAGAPVGDERGRTVPYVQNNTNNPADPAAQPNLWPWCVYDVAKAQANHWPQCPASIYAATDSAGDNPYTFTADQAETWTVRGAVNAGLGVFLYVKSLESLSSPPADYNQCPPAN
jgi:mono/diheme cytochrome c family protein